MADTPEVIRQQMDETRSQLTGKLESLEHQVSATVQSTGSAVNATVGAVQETVESVTGAVQDALHSVTNAFDIRQHIDKHPWLILGGSVVLGYLAADFLEESAKRSSQRPGTSPGSSDDARHRNGTSAHESPAAAGISPALGSTLSKSPWDQITQAATAALIGIVQDASSRLVPEVMEYLNRNKVRPNSVESDPLTPETRKCSTVTTLD